MTVQTVNRTSTPQTAPPSLDEILSGQRAAFLREGIPDLATRKDRLSRLHSMLADNVDDIVDAIVADFGTRPLALCSAGDVGYVINEIIDLRRHLKGWLHESARRPSRLAGLRYEVRHDPLGVVGIAGPWNFPVQLTMTPAAGALAAGNRLMIRPSSVTRNTGDALARCAPNYFSIDELAIITADHGPGSRFSKLAFDSFFFTGSPKVGVEVAKDCATNLVPATLELGGKNPAIVDSDADIKESARRIAGARMMNSGQICLSPDYVFVPEAKLNEFVEQVIQLWHTMFPTIRHTAEYTAIINDANFDRILAHLDDARSCGATLYQVIPDGEELPDRENRLIPPTIVTGLRPEMSIEGDEVFGPVLSVHTYRHIDEAIDLITSRDHPLTLYWFGPENERLQRTITGTRSGSVNINDFMVNMTSAAIPFGGVGKSGMGSYHGRHSIATFTHARTVAASRLRFGLATSVTPGMQKRAAGPIARAIRWTSPHRDLTAKTSHRD